MARAAPTGVVVVVCAAVLAGCSSPQPASKGNQNPAVSGYSVRPHVLPAGGGNVTVYYTDTGGTQCQVVSVPKLTSNPGSAACTSGATSLRLKIPPNQRAAVVDYKLTVAITNTNETVISPYMYVVLAAPAPLVSSLTSTPSGVGSTGGSITIKAQVLHSSECYLSAIPPVKGLDKKVHKCKSKSGTASFSEPVTLPANKKGKIRSYLFTLRVVGGPAGMPPPLPNGPIVRKPKKDHGSGTTTTTSAPASTTTSTTSVSPTTSSSSSGTTTTTKTSTPGSKHKTTKPTKAAKQETSKSLTVVVGRAAAASISSFTASPSSIGAAGGPMTLTANLSGATSLTTCEFSSKGGRKAITGLPVTRPCTGSSTSAAFTVSPNTKKAGRKLSFLLVVKVPHLPPNKSKIVVEQAGVMPISPKPSFKFSVSPNPIPAKGSPVVLKVTDIKHGTSCTFSSSTPVNGLTKTEACSGSASVTVTIDKNTGGTRTFDFIVTVSGPGGSNTAHEYPAQDGQTAKTTKAAKTTTPTAAIVRPRSSFAATYRRLREQRAVEGGITLA
ncbi:MAG: hypothetical protein ACLPQS_08910 [Acidimicrobiales bacterium]